MDPVKKPYDVFAHQILSMLMEHSGVGLAQFHNLNHEFLNWQSITDSEYETLIRYLLDSGFIEILEQEVITGSSTEPLLRGSDFYTHFFTERNFAVHTDMKKIGEIPLTPSVAVGVNIFLAAKIWKIDRIDMQGKRIHVTKAVDGNLPVYLSGAGNTSGEIRRRMKEILLDPRCWENYDQPIQMALGTIIADNMLPSNPYWAVTPSGVGLRTFAGSKVNQTLLVFFDMICGASTFRLDDKKTLIFCNDSTINMRAVLAAAMAEDWDGARLDAYFRQSDEIVARYMQPVKYSELLPMELKIKYIIENILDLKQANDYLKHFDGN